MLANVSSTQEGPMQPPPATTVDIANDSHEKLLEDIVSKHVDPLWTQMNALVPPTPQPKSVPHKWEYAAVRPQLIRAGQLVPEQQAERRVLMLTNPALAPPYTTDTLYAGLQLVLPGETAPAHRHTAFALRFVVEGQGGFTAVQGKRIKMTRGDFILTPTWQFHDHGNDGVASPMIWLDGLDLPQFQHFPVHFAQHYSKPRYPAEDAPEDVILFRWADMQKKLEGEGKEHAIIRYTSQERGKEGRDVSVRLGAQCELIAAGTTSAVRQENSSSVYHVIDGSGRSVIGTTTIDWVKGDTFAIPSWLPYTHEAASTTYLFRFDDQPMLKALNFYRNQAENFLEQL